MNAQLALIKANVDNAMVVTTMGTVPGVDLVMWTIRMCSASRRKRDARYGG